MSVDSRSQHVGPPTNAIGRIWRLIFGHRKPLAAPSAARVSVPTLVSVGERLRAYPPDLVAALLTPPPQPLENALTIRPDVDASFARILEEWSSGAPHAVCISGPRGSGMSSLMSALAARARAIEQRSDDAVPAPTLITPGARIRSERALVDLLAAALEFEDVPSNVDELIAQLVTGPPRIIFVEDIQDFMLRTIGGNDAIEAFLAIVAATTFRVLWVTSCRTQALRLFEYQHGISRHLPTRLDARIEDESTLFDIIDYWNASLPYPVRFAGPDDARARAAAQDAPATKAQYLAALWKVADGNLVATRLHWLNSITYYDATYDTTRDSTHGTTHGTRHETQRGPAQDVVQADAQEVVQHPIETPSLDYVRSLDREKLFTLLSVFQHAGLSVDEHAEIYLTSPAASRRTFESLVQLGLLDSLAGGENSNRYDVNPAADAPLVRLLEQLNLIY